MNTAPIVLFVYKRAEHTRKCLEALNHNEGIENTDLIIYSDGPREEKDDISVKEVREYIKMFAQVSSFRHVEIVESPVNKGLARSIISGVSNVMNQYGKAIVVEDDLVTSTDFWRFMDGALQYYENYPQIGSVSGCTYPIKYLEDYKKDIYVIRKGECWGWATWKERWDEVDWDVCDFTEYKKNRKLRKQFNSLECGLDHMLISQMTGKIDSWAVRWCYHLFKRKLLTVYPAVSRTYNIGMDGTGEHCPEATDYEFKLYTGNFQCNYEIQEVNVEIEKQVAIFEKQRSGWIVTRIIERIFNRKRSKL